MHTRYRVAWVTRDGRHHRTSPRFATVGAAEVWRRLVLRDPAVQSAVVQSVNVQLLA